MLYPMLGERLSLQGKSLPTSIVFFRDYRLKGWRFFQFETVHVIILSCLQDFIYDVSVAVDNAGQRILEKKRLGEEESGIFW